MRTRAKQKVAEKSEKKQDVSYLITQVYSQRLGWRSAAVRGTYAV